MSSQGMVLASGGYSPPRCSVCASADGSLLCLCAFPPPALCATCLAAHTRSRSQHLSVPVSLLPAISCPQDLSSQRRKIANLTFVQSQLTELALRKVDSALKDIDKAAEALTSQLQAAVSKAKASAAKCRRELETIVQGLESLKFSQINTPQNLYERIALGYKRYDGPVSMLYDCFEAKIDLLGVESALRSAFQCELHYPELVDLQRSESFSTASTDIEPVIAQNPMECAHCKISLQAMFTAGFAPVQLPCGHSFHNKQCFIRFLQQHSAAASCPLCSQSVTEEVVQKHLDLLDVEKLANRARKRCKRCSQMTPLQALECGHAYCAECCSTIKKGRVRCPICVETETLVRNIAF